MFKVNNKNTRRRERCRPGVCIVNFEHISHLFLVFLLFILKNEMLAGECVSSKIASNLQIVSMYA